MTQSTLEPYLKIGDEIRLDNESRKLEERYWSTTSENPNDLLARAEEFLSENEKSSNNRARDIAIPVDLIENGTVKQRETINGLFNSKFGFELFKRQERPILKLYEPCWAEDEFPIHIYSLGILVDEMNTDDLRRQCVNSGVTGNLQVYLTTF